MSDGDLSVPTSWPTRKVVAAALAISIALTAIAKGDEPLFSSMEAFDRQLRVVTGKAPQEFEAAVADLVAAFRERQYVNYSATDDGPLARLVLSNTKITNSTLDWFARRELTQEMRDQATLDCQSRLFQKAPRQTPYDPKQTYSAAGIACAGWAIRTFPLPTATPEISAFLGRYGIQPGEGN